jgi:hypothetical protein
MSCGIATPRARARLSIERIDAEGKFLSRREGSLHLEILERDAAGELAS